MTEEPAGSGSGDDHERRPSDVDERRASDVDERRPSDESEREGTEEIWSREPSNESDRGDGGDSWSREGSGGLERGDDEGSWGRDTSDDSVWGRDEYPAPSEDSPFGQTAAGAEAGDDQADDRPYGPEPSSTPIDPGTIDFEHAVFVLLGALAMVAVLVWIAGLAV